jgi:ribA/ribD-fused uncharacterized protein
MKVTDKHVFFWGEWPSNWYPCVFTAEYEGKEYTFYNSEQYFMFVKAKTFGDEENALKILLEGKNPKKAKTYGRMVKNYDDEKWNEIRYKVMVYANMAKYSHNDELKNLLLSDEFNGKGFVEASPIDGVWGIKCSEEDALDDESNWNGQNLLGKALDEVRDNLMNVKI